MPRIRVTAITPKGKLFQNPTAKIERRLVSHLGRVQNAVQKYPPQEQPTDYVRTGNLGRNWRTRVSRRNGNLEGEIANPVEYAGYVEGFADGEKGERQTKVMRDKGWPQLDTEFDREWPKTVKAMQQDMDDAAKGKR